MDTEATTQANSALPRPGKWTADGKPCYQLTGAIPFVLVHLCAFGAFFVDVQPVDIAVGVALYWIRMFGVTGVYHRYYSHRSYKTSRVFQFILALIAMSSSQRGVLWWAAHHRHHHKYSDMVNDIHSPKQHGLFYAHVGWVFNHNESVDYSKIRDFGKYPELMFLDKFWALPPILLGFGVWFLLGWSGLWVGFMASTAILWHGTFTINSFTHLWGKRVYETTDDSRNSMLFALITMGEGWHNNHHYYQSCCPQGFEWWQIDVTYYVLRVLSWFGLVWDIRMPPEYIVANRIDNQPSASSE